MRDQYDIPNEDMTPEQEIKQLKEELKSNNNLYESVQREYDVQIQKLEEMKQAYIKVDKLFIQQYKKLEKIEKLPVKYVDTQACEDFQRCIRELKEILET